MKYFVLDLLDFGEFLFLRTQIKQGIMQFIGFLIFVVIASAAFFTVFALGAVLPSAFVPKKEEEDEETLIEE